jgi:hypothetical protein
MYEDYLMHHGILGQKWGVRRFQNSDGSLTAAGRERYGISEKQVRKDQARMNFTAKMGQRDDHFREKHTIPAGTKMYRTTVDPDEAPHEAMYVSYLDPDRYPYRGGWVRTTGKADKAYENEYTLTKDVTVPGRDELSKVIKDVVQKDPEVMSNTVRTWCEMNNIGLTGVLNYSPAYTDRGKQFMADLMAQVGEQPASKSYYMLAQTFGKNPELRGLVISELKQRGYNAMTDEASVGGAKVKLPGVKKNIDFERHGVDALILFDGNDVLQKDKTSHISRFSEMRYAGKQRRWQNRAAWAKGKWGVMDGVAL